MAQINQVPRKVFPGMDPAFAQHYTQMVDTVNSLAGYNGVIEVKNHLNMGGNRVMNAAAAVESGDAVTQSYADSNYSASALRPQLEAGGSSPLQSPRRINDQVQRESYSSYLNDILSTPPNANNIQVLFSSPGGGMTTITIPASIFRFADGSTLSLNSYSLTVSNPANFNIAASPTGAVSSGTVATITTTGASGVVPGNYVQIAGVADTDFNGEWVVATAAGLSFTFATTIAAAASGGGTVTTSSIYYFYIVKGNPNPQYLGVPAGADTPYNRLPTSTDGRQLIAVASVNSSGGVSSSSAGGGTPGSTLNAGSFF